MSSKTNTVMMWPKTRGIDWRPQIATCVVCEKPIYGALGMYEGDNYILMENGDTIHDKPRCGMTYLRDRYLCKG